MRKAIAAAVAVGLVIGLLVWAWPTDQPDAFSRPDPALQSVSDVEAVEEYLEGAPEATVSSNGSYQPALSTILSPGLFTVRVQADQPTSGSARPASSVMATRRDGRLFYTATAPDRMVGVDLTDTAPSTAAITEEGGKFAVGSNSIIRLDRNTISSYDRDTFEHNWKQEILRSTPLNAVAADGTVHVLLRTPIRSSDVLCSARLHDTLVPCSNVHRLNRTIVRPETTYDFMSMDAETGEIRTIRRIIAPPGSAATMTRQGAYVALPFLSERGRSVIDFILTDGQKHFPGDLKQKLREGREEDGYSRTYNRYRSAIVEHIEQSDAPLNTLYRTYLYRKRDEWIKTAVAQFGLSGQPEQLRTVNGRPARDEALFSTQKQRRLVTTVEPPTGHGEVLHNIQTFGANLQRKKRAKFKTRDYLQAINLSGDHAFLRSAEGLRLFGLEPLNDLGEFRPKDPSFQRSLSNGYFVSVETKGRGQMKKKTTVRLFDGSGFPYKTVDHLTIDATGLYQHRDGFYADKQKRFVLTGKRDAWIVSYKNDSLSVEQRVALRAKPRHTTSYDGRYFVLDRLGVTAMTPEKGVVGRYNDPLANTQHNPRNDEASTSMEGNPDSLLRDGR